MQNSANTALELPEPPLNGLLLSRLCQAVDGLSADQLNWASGYLAGLGAARPAGQTAANETPVITILYATHGGNARSVAEELSESAGRRGLASRLVSAEQYRPRDLLKERLLMVVICTQGEGEPPDSARELFKYLNGKKPPTLADLQYAIFGLGDSSYEHFCQAGKDLDELLKACGARSLAERVDADIDFNVDAEGWSREILSRAEQDIPADLARVIPLQRTSASRRYDRNHPYRAELLERRRITTSDSLSEVHHLSLEIDGTAIRYHPGDSVGVYFRNDPALIEEVLDLTGLSGDATVNLNGDSLTLAQALGERLELSQLHPKVASAWAALADAPELSALNKDSDAWRNFTGERQLIDLLQAYPVTLEAEQLVKLLHPQQPRLYSIASSQAVREDEIHLTVSALRYRAHGRDHLGGASGYLTRRIAEGDSLNIYVAENPAFRLPEAGDAPIVMVGAGTGIAPYRAFMQERAELGSRGRNWLVFGSRHFHRDFLYQTDWLKYRKDGLLNRVSLAFSRDAGDGAYVQTRLDQEAAELYRWLEEGAHLYVCGCVEMEMAVRLTLQRIAQVQGGLSEEATDEYIESLREQGRYLRDVY